MFSARFYNVKCIVVLIFTTIIVVYYITRQGARNSTHIFYNFCQSNNMWSYWYQCNINVYFFLITSNLCSDCAFFLLSISHAESLPSTHQSHWRYRCISSKCSWSSWLLIGWFWTEKKILCRMLVNRVWSSVTSTVIFFPYCGNKWLPATVWHLPNNLYFSTDKRKSYRLNQGE